ncbi:hypothetical protein, partial [Sphingopyxis sp. KK2]|uniref:hypothetical protein n=1 Tax=Sphingopyxis sp. KK2 TaxID=1855727 RepID=UPI001181B044
MTIRILLLAATALSFVPGAQAQDDRIAALERKLEEQQKRIDQLEALVTRQATLIEQSSPPAPA